MDDEARQRWIEEAAADLRAALRDPAIRAAVAGLVVGEADQRNRRLADVAEDLAGFEVAWQRKKGNDDG